MTTAPSGANELRFWAIERSSEELVRRWEIDDDEDAIAGAGEVVWANLADDTRGYKLARMVVRNL